MPCFLKLKSFWGQTGRPHPQDFTGDQVPHFRTNICMHVRTLRTPDAACTRSSNLWRRPAPYSAWCQCFLFEKNRISSLIWWGPIHFSVKVLMSRRSAPQWGQQPESKRIRLSGKPWLRSWTKRPPVLMVALVSVLAPSQQRKLGWRRKKYLRPPSHFSLGTLC